MSSGRTNGVIGREEVVEVVVANDEVEAEGTLYSEAERASEFPEHGDAVSDSTGVGRGLNAGFLHDDSVFGRGRGRSLGGWLSVTVFVDTADGRRGCQLRTSSRSRESISALHDLGGVGSGRSILVLGGSGDE